MKPETDIASEEYEDLLARIESLEKIVKDIHIGGDQTLGNIHVLGLITGIFRSGTGIKDVDLDGFQMDGDEFVCQASGADNVVLNTSGITATGGTLTVQSISAGTGTKDVDLTGWILDVDEICGQASGVDQVVIVTAAGKLTAGAGAVTLQADGLWIDGVEVWSKGNTRFRLGGTETVPLGWLGLLEGVGGSNQLVIEARPDADTDDSYIKLAVCDASDTNEATLRLFQTANGTTAGLELYKGSEAGTKVLAVDLTNGRLQFADANTEIWEDGDGHLNFKAAALIEFDTPTFCIDTANDRVGIGEAAPQTELDLAGRLRIDAAGTAPTSGEAIEIYLASSVGYISAYDRDGSAGLPLHLSSFIFMPGLKSGATQVAAGAVANELWVDTDTAVIKRGS